MAQRIIPFTVQVNPGSSPAAPVAHALNFGAADVVQIDVMVPPGPAGFVGFFVGNGGGQYVPEGIGEYIVADDKYLIFPVEGGPNNGNWNVTAYNQGNYTHNLYVYFHVNNITLTQAAASATPIGL